MAINSRIIRLTLFLRKVSPRPSFTSRPRLLITVLAVLAMLAIAGSISHVRNVRHFNALLASKQATLKAQQDALAYSAKAANTKSPVKPDTKPAAQTSDTPAPAPGSTAVTKPKYSTSSDPRSTSFSEAPPTPAPETVDIKITRHGQVPVGTLISYNPLKDNTKFYFGGEITFDKPVITVSRSTPWTWQHLTAFNPNGVATHAPSALWYEHPAHFFVAYDSANHVEFGSAFPIIVDRMDNPLVVGSYQVHIANSYASGSEVQEYHGFITVIVTE